MAAYKVINLDSPIESDYWVDIPVRDPATNKDAVDEKGRILVERHVTRSVKNEEMSTINAAVETVNTLKVDYSTFKEEVSTKVNNHDSSILTNTNNITTLTDSVNNHDLQINALYTKINAIQGIDIDNFKYVTETDIKNIKKNYLPLAGGTVTGNVVFTGSVSSNSPIKANLQGTANRAIGDTNGKALTSYIANLKVSGASLTVTNGAGKASNYIVDNVNHATNATNATQSNKLTLTRYVRSDCNNVTSLGNPVVVATEYSRDSANLPSAHWYQMLTLNSSDANYNNQLAFNMNALGMYYRLRKEGSWGSWVRLIDSTNIGSQSVKYATNATNATNANHATTATKATQDSAGQQINTTYVKGVTTSNATITVTKGNGTTSTATINNVANATNAINADKLDGLHASASVSANTVVVRDVNGYVNFNYINSNTNNNENPSISQIIVTNGSDNYYRKASLAHLKNSMGITTGVVPTGAVIFVAMDSIPSGYLVCHGGAVSRTTYSALFAKIGTKYGRGNGSTTFNLPNLMHRFIQGNATVGDYKSAGLPDITGQISGSDGQTYVAKGAFTKADGMAQSKSQFATYGESCAHIFSFSARNSNTIYGASATVQPPALTLLPCIKY